jgi:hypothetical protein
MNEYFLPDDISRCSNEDCSKKLKCSRYLDRLPFDTYWYSEFKESEECFIEKEDTYKKK